MIRRLFLEKKIIGFLNRKSKIRGAPIIEIIYGAFANKLKDVRSPDIEIIFRKNMEFFCLFCLSNYGKNINLHPRLNTLNLP